MEGMESVYLKGKAGRQKSVSWCSQKVTFKDYFSKFSDKLHDVFPSARTTTKDIFHGILPEDELSNESLKNLTELTDPKNFKMKIRNGNISDEISQPSSTSKQYMPSTSKGSNQSISGEGIPSTSKQQAASRDWVEAEIVSSIQEETINVPARKIGQGPIKNQNTEVKKKQRKRDVNKSDNKDKKNHLHVQHDSAAEKTASGPDKRPTINIKTNERKTDVKKSVKRVENNEVQNQHDATLSSPFSDPDKRVTTKIKTYERKKNVKQNIKMVENNKVQNQHDVTLSAPIPNKRSIPEIKEYQMKGNVQREINEEVKDNLTSSEEIHENVSQFLTNLLAEGIPLTSKQQDKAASRNWVEAMIVSSIEEDIENEPTIEIGQGSINNQNNEVEKKKIINKSDTVGENDHVDIQHNAAAETIVPDPDESSTTEIKKSINRVKNNEVQNRHDATLSAPEIKTNQMKGNVQRVVHKGADEILFQLPTNVSTEERVTGSTKRSNTVLSTCQNKTNAHNSVNGAINEQVQVPQNATSSEAIEIVSQLLESLLINLNSDSELSIGNPQTPIECFDLQSKTNVKIAVKVDRLSTEESVTKIGNTLDIVTPSTFHHNENMATTPENPDVFKVPLRRSIRRRIKKKQVEEVSRNKCEVQETEELQNACNCNDTSEPTEGAEENSEPRYFRDIISEITKRSSRNKRRNKTVRGQIIVDTTKRLGKKDLIPRKHFVVSFRIHKSFQQNMGQRGVRPGKCLQEIEVLNYQTLADLRKTIMCEADYQDTAGDVSNWPYTPVKNIAKNIYKSGMFYINNTFYVDTRKGSEDYSVVIRKWAEEHFIQVGETKPMEGMKIEDLEMRMGYPYVYMHQGSCEHLIIISDARLLTEKKSLHSSDYPNLTKTTRSLVYYCVTCSVKPASWVVIGSKQMVQDTNFMCEGCFHSFHYVGTQKVGNFKAYRWRQRAILFH